MTNLVNIKISTDTLYNMFYDRVDFWYKGFNGRELSATERNLFLQMYERYIDNGVFDNGFTLDVNYIVDNDVVGNCMCFESWELGEEFYEKLIQSYKDGCEEELFEEFEKITEVSISCIEAIDEDNGAVLIRH